MRPLISVIIPSYNSEKYIYESIKSVISQTYDNWECLIIDDGSTDNSKLIIDNLILNESRIKYFYKSNSGLADTRNYGIKFANGDLIQFLDSDDVIHPKKFEFGVNAYIENNEFIYFTDFEFTEEENPYKINTSIKKLTSNFKILKAVDFNMLYSEWDINFVIPTHAFLFPKKIFKLNRYDIALKSKEDWDFYLSILFNDQTKFKSIDYVGCGYRVRGNSMSQDIDNMLINSIIVLNKWKSSEIKFILKGAYYLLNFNVKKVKGHKGSLIHVYKELKKIIGINPFKIILMQIIAPIFILQKIIK